MGAGSGSVEKIDLKKDLAAVYKAGKAPVLVEVPPLSFLMIDGEGNPNGPEFQDAVGALYTVAYTLKFDLKKAGRLDWTVGPLEGLWSTNGRNEIEVRVDPGQMRWTAMIVQPRELRVEDVERVRPVVAEKRDLPALPRLRFEVYEEGLSAQVLHVGPYGEESTTIERLHAFIHEQGYQPHRRHHEIYLSDPNRTDAARLRTILRQPVQQAT
jgi:hypothetical protein